MAYQPDAADPDSCYEAAKEAQRVDTWEWFATSDVFQLFKTATGGRTWLQDDGKLNCLYQCRASPIL